MKKWNFTLYRSEAKGIDFINSQLNLQPRCCRKTATVTKGIKNVIATLQKKFRPMQNIRRNQKALKKRGLVVLGALFLDKFNEQFQVFRIHIRQNTVTKVENVA